MNNVRTNLFLALFGLIAALAPRLHAALPPQVGDTAPSFSLHALNGDAVELSALLQRTPVLLVVLRGWPGYQCPICTKQVREFTRRAADFAPERVQVVMVYPGPAKDLEAHAQEFLHDKEWPPEFRFVIDPDYTFTSRYGLRWDAKNETAYPSTFVIQQDGRVSFAHISHSHGDRVNVSAALKALNATK